MTLPATYSAALLCLALSLVCIGSWPNLLKLSGKWRYELFYGDFSFGFLLVSVVAALTLGSLNSKNLTVQDNLLIASYHKIGYSLGAGVVLNLACLLLVAALSVAPMAIAFPVSGGIALVVGLAWTLSPPEGSLLLYGAGSVLVLVAVVINAFLYGAYMQEQRALQVQEQPEPRRRAQRPPRPAKGVALSAISGVLFGLVSPLVIFSRAGEDGLGPYTAGLMSGIAAIVSTLFFSPFFFAFAVHGAPVQLRAYFKGSKGQHFAGLLGGVLWGAGLIAAFASGGSQATVEAGPVPTRAFAAGAALLATLWGLLAWREFRGASVRVKTLLAAMLILWSAGAALLAVGPNFGQ